MSVVLAFGGRASRRPVPPVAFVGDLFAGLSSPCEPPPDPFWWPVPGRLAAGPCPGGTDGVTAREDLARLAAAGVRHLIDLTGEHEHASYQALLPALSLALTRPVGWERHPFVEGGVPGVAQLNRILDRLDALIAVGAVPCIHGLGGRGRTVLVAACWRVRHGEAPRTALAEAERAWQATRPHARTLDVPETLEQRRFVHEWPRGDRRLFQRGMAGRAA